MSAAKFNVLLVEDDALDVINVTRALESDPHVGWIKVAANGAAALELLRREPETRRRTVVLTDLCMPRMGGWELLREIRDDDKLCGVPVVVLTTSADLHDRRAAFTLNAAGYLIKTRDPVGFKSAMAAFAAYWARVEFPV